MAWICRRATPLHWLAKLNRVPHERLIELSWGAAVTRAELEVLAKAWDIEVGDLIRSAAGAVEIIG